MVGGAKSLIVKTPELFVNNDEEDRQMPGVPEFYSAWPKKDIAGWTGAKDAEFEEPAGEGGVWTGGECDESRVSHELIFSLWMQCRLVPFCWATARQG
jgi:uncharacterized protein YbdZ (MbtH family)